MMLNENLLPLDEIATQIPGGGRHRSTLWRWCRQGYRGVFLEHRDFCGRIYTSLEALERFGKAVAEAGQRAREVRPAPPAKTQLGTESRGSAAQTAEDYLAAIGV